LAELPFLSGTGRQRHKEATVKRLDEIAMLVDMPNTADRYSRLSDFLDSALERGVIEKDEHDRLRYELAKEI